jgi:hypothetical protein
MKEEQPEAKMAIDTKGPVTAEDVTEEDMMAMMGFAGFGTTKVSLSPVLLGFNGTPTGSLAGSSCRRKPGRCCQDQPATDMAPVYEQVRTASCFIYTLPTHLQEGRFQQASGEGQIVYIIFYSMAARGTWPALKRWHCSGKSCIYWKRTC